MRNFDDLLASMSGRQASDLFLTAGKPPALRIQGEMVLTDDAPTTAEDLERLMSSLLTPSSRVTFEKRGDLDIGYDGPDGRYRLNLHRQRGRVGIVARALASGHMDLASLNLPPQVGQLADIPRGMVLVTGATGSGKSTTLMALIHRINATRAAHIVTIEDPIEFVHEDMVGRVTQREVGADTEDFATALKHVLRESPDVILIGEIRDQYTMSVAIAAAMTGHLVLSSLHTMDAAQALQRILSLYPEGQRKQLCMDLSMCLNGIVSLRLLPRVDSTERVPAIELLTVTPPVQRLLRDQRVEEIGDLMRGSSDPSVSTFNQSLVELYKSGAITFETGLAYASHPEEFRLAVGGMQVGVDSFRDLADTATTGVLDFKYLLSMAVEHGASDLHLCGGRPPILRINGELKRVGKQDLTTADVRSLLFSVLSSRQRSVFELEKELDFSLSIESGVRFRVNAYFQRGQAAVAVRAVPSRIPPPEELGLPEALVELSGRPHGLILVVGPTGSGKSTTLASLIHTINRRKACRIVTIEDPIEYSHASVLATIDQREVESDTDSFHRALKYVLRQDPDVIMVGEMRDPETISAVLTAAETGHLVFATLHTNDACQTIDRVVDSFPPHQQGQVRLQLAATLLAVSSQRLLPRADGGGRLGVFELLLCTPAIRAVIREGKTFQIPNLMSTGYGQGMITLERSLEKLRKQGLLREEDVVRYTAEIGLTQK